MVKTTDCKCCENESFNLLNEISHLLTVLNRDGKVAEEFVINFDKLKTEMYYTVGRQGMNIVLESLRKLFAKDDYLFPCYNFFCLIHRCGYNAYGKPGDDTWEKCQILYKLNRIKHK